MLPGELGRSRRIGLAIWLRPRRPVPEVRVAFVDGFVQRGMHREAMQQVAFVFDVGAKFMCLRSIVGKLQQKETPEENSQEPRFQVVDSLVLDKLARPERCDFGPYSLGG